MCVYYNRGRAEGSQYILYTIYIYIVPFSLRVCACVRACATGRRHRRRRRPSLFRSVTINRRGRGRWGQKRETAVYAGEIYTERKGGQRSKLI